MTTPCVWVQLCWEDKDKEMEEPAGDDLIKIRPVPDDVADLKAAVLARLDSALLGEVKVYPPKSCASREKYQAGKELSAVMAELSGTTPPTSSDYPLVVVAPTQTVKKAKMCFSFDESLPKPCDVVPLKSTKPEFVAPDGWLDGVGIEIVAQIQRSDDHVGSNTEEYSDETDHDGDQTLERVAPMAVVRCSRGGNQGSL
ncbi:hypothetical protein SEMRO_3280_G346150.1 [Seminavis robusta]|uniref:Uncharacterized protein n=1 Tax=Seminavis robusta TaxID=568900 RepID=A0A9N8F3W2_9STRA|nr:hypothetical protein SEMRO_3280_G346150.1 [Seminavis robusta]|eukprot:Sro3280_g346150.1 n/a (199) ;mRNA; f:2065-2661